MRSFSGTCLLVFAVFPSIAGAARLADADKSAAVGKVVKMLEDMLKQSQADWNSDTIAYVDFKCYCDDNTDKKTKAIQEATTSIGLLSNKIDELHGSSGALSIKTSELKADMAENEQARSDAKALREKEEKAFQEEKADLTAAIGQMDEAIKMLSGVGADQTMASAADHEKFMGKYKEKSLVSLRSSVKLALSAAISYLDTRKKAKLEAFIQGPFTGSYTAQSGQVVGILKDMKDTFQSNLQQAEQREKSAKDVYNKFKTNKEGEHDDLKKSYDTKQSSLGTNDGDLATKKMQLQQFTKQKGEDEEFLAKLSVQCADKKKEYEKRKLFAANEEAALSKAIAILSNDVASEKFGAVDATSKGKTGLFFQLSAVRRAAAAHNTLTDASDFLRKAASQQHSERLSKALMLLQTGNPFSVILQHIDKMIKMAEDEQTVDQDQKSWCETTNTRNNKNLGDVKDDLTTIEADIGKLQADINDPKTGMKKQLSDAQKSLATNLKNQGEETSTRRKENVDYQKDVSTMSDAIGMLTKAEKVLTGYYDSLDEEQVGLLQQDPKVPKTFEGAYKGQNEQAKKVLGMLAFIKSETEKEEGLAHDSELKAQHDFEDSMKSLVEGEASLQETIVKLNEDLANTEKELLSKHEDQTNTEQQKVAVERYIEKIKPGCDFILKNFDLRTQNRSAEKKALQEVKTKLKGTPAFTAAQQKAKEADFGKCKTTCLKDEDHANCKACMAGVSVPGYCAGHAGSKGC